MVDAADHDLLTSIAGRMEYLVQAMEEIKEQHRDTCTWKKEADRDLTILRNERIPERLDSLENWKSTTIGALIIISFIFTSSVGALIWKVFFGGPI